MLTITVEQKYCHCQRVLTGDSIAQIFKDNGLSYDTWNIVDIQMG